MQRRGPSCGLAGMSCGAHDGLGHRAGLSQPPGKNRYRLPAGGPTDFVGRLLADKLKEDLGQSFLIENKGGAGGTLGADYVAKADPDGYTLFLTTVGAVAITPHMRANMPYNPTHGFCADHARRAQHHRDGGALARIRQTPPRSLRNARRRNPKRFRSRSTGSGTTPHLRA